VQYVVWPSIGNIFVETLQARSHPGDRAVVIRPLLVDDALKAALPFVEVVGNIRDKVGVASLALSHNPIFVIAKIGRAQPECVIQLIGVTVGYECINGMFDGIRGVKR
jgi:hypothetical protein